MTLRRSLALGSTAAAALAALAAAPAGGIRDVFPDHPPVAHTGGFGEPTCRACHFGEALNDPAGSLALRGAPEAYGPGGRHRITVVLERAGMAAGGFQLAARCEDGSQAGELAPADARRVAVAEDANTGVRYAHQTAEGVEPGQAGRAEWAVEWIAPAAGCGAVRFDAAANAGNGDDSSLGDHVYAGSTQSRSAAP